MTSSNRRLVDNVFALALENVAVRAARGSAVGVTLRELTRLAEGRAAARRQVRRRVRRSFLAGAVVGAGATAAAHRFGGTPR